MHDDDQWALDQHDRFHEEPLEHADDCDICAARVEERKANGEYDTTCPECSPHGKAIECDTTHCGRCGVRVIA